MITNSNQETKIAFSPTTKTLIYLEENCLSILLKQNEYQLRKLLHNKKVSTFDVGFEIKFSFKTNSDAIDLNDRTKIVVYDRHLADIKIYTIEKGTEPIVKIFTDGSFLEKKKIGAYVALIQNIDNKFNLSWGKSDYKSSSLNELLAVISGLKILKNENKIRIITDSRYVIKGLTEWILNWKLNDWKTIQGTEAKNIIFWKEFDNLTKNKYIEFQWIKGHSFHFENTLCDKYAKEAALSFTKKKIGI